MKKKIKKVLKVIGIMMAVLVTVLIILMVKSYFDNKKPVISENYYENTNGGADLEKKYALPGTYEVSSLEYDSDNTSIDKIRIWYPTELESNNKKYPLIMVVNASNVQAYKYKPFFEKLASWGFIVVGNDDGQAGTGETTSITLDYILNLDEDNILYRKIDTENVGILGYSQGGASAIRAVTEYENGAIYKTMFTGSAAYPVLAKNMGWEYDASKIKISYFMTAGTGKTDDSGADPETEYGGICPLSALVDNYNHIATDVMKIRARVVGAEHEDMLLKTDSYMTAWFLYQLKNDEEAKTVFAGDDAEIVHNLNWQDIEKTEEK